MIPSVEACFELMEKYEMLGNIRAHSIIVEKIALRIASGLQKAGAGISLEKVAAGALLHDIGKTLCLNSRDDHEAKGREICLQNHLKEIAEIVGQHVRLKNYRPDGAICEKEIVYYADKRVNHDEIVSLDERLKYILDRYGQDNATLHQRIRDNFHMCKDVEQKLFANLSFNPEDI